MLVLIVGQRYALICVGLVGRIVEVSAFSVEDQVFGIRGVLKNVRVGGLPFGATVFTRPQRLGCR